MANASFLPALHDCNGVWDQVLASLYSIFERDLKQHKCQHDAKSIIYDGRIKDDGGGKEEGFWHLVEKGPPGNRVFDPPRAEKRPWFRPTCETADAAITAFDYDTGNSKKGVRRYVWIKADDYVVVLKIQKRILFLVTAYHVDGGGTADLERRYKNRVGA
jgi:hypothetical protein